MKYKALLQFLRILIYVKRFFWWIGAKIYFILEKIWRIFIFIKYKIGFFFKKRGVSNIQGFFLRRGFLQVFFFITLLIIVLPHTQFFSKKNLGIPGQETLAYRLVGRQPEEYGEEIAYIDTSELNSSDYSWRDTVLSPEFFNSSPSVHTEDLSGFIPGGSAISKPQLISGLVGIINRNKIENYIVEPGDSLGSIASDFGISVATILWENGLTTKSIIRPGDVLKILPTTGLMHTVKKGDTFNKIATLYEAKSADIISFNNLGENGTGLKIGERILVPNGVKPEQRAVATVRRTDTSAARVAVPPSSRQAPSVGGFVWPSGARNITQYYHWGHQALDIAGPMGTPTYAAKSGTVETAQCGWNGGYGCYVIINHGGGIKTLYGHHSKLLVSPGDYVEAGQTIALMGNTGNVRGRTGIHVHFEIIINGARVNPLGYVK